MALDHPSDMSLAQQLAAVQDWWLDAGVDCAFVDEPQAMLREPEVAAPPRSRTKVIAVEAEAIAPAPLVAALAAGDPSIRAMAFGDALMLCTEALTAAACDEIVAGLTTAWET